MLTKIKREDCLIQYPKFPQTWYNAIKDEEEYKFPKIISNYWLSLNSTAKRRSAVPFVKEAVNFLTDTEFEKLIFLGESSRPWLTKLSLSRSDYKPLTNAVEYLLNNKIGKRFNGAIEVERSELPAFIKHFFYLVRSDGSLPYINFMDEGQNFYGFLHYSGELCVRAFNKKTDKLFVNLIKESKLSIVKASYT